MTNVSACLQDSACEGACCARMRMCGRTSVRELGRACDSVRPYTRKSARFRPRALPVVGRLSDIAFDSESNDV